MQMTRVLLPFDRIADESSEPREIAAPTTISSLRPTLRRMHTFVGPKAKVVERLAFPGPWPKRSMPGERRGDGETERAIARPVAGSGVYLEDCIVGPSYEVWVGE